MSFNTNEWKPGPKQALFLSLPDSIKEGMMGGGAGTGKSDILLLYSIAKGWYTNPGFKQLFQRRTYGEIKREILPRSRDLYTKFGATVNRTDMAWTFPRPDQYGGSGMGNMGAMIFLGHCENEDDVHIYDGMEPNLYTPDELPSFTEYQYLYIAFSRVRAAIGSGLPEVIRAAGMPGGIGHTWVKKRFVDPHPLGSVIINGRGGNKRIYIHTTLADNPYISPSYAQSLEALPEAEKRAKKHGDWSAYLGQVFDEFRERHYETEPTNAVHVVEPFEIPKWWPRIVIGDWGFAAMTYILYAAISPTRRIYCYREQFFIRTKIEEWVPYVKEYIDREEPRKIIFCKSVGYEHGQEHTIQEQIESAFDRPIEFPAQMKGSRIAGKQLIHEYLRWKPTYIPISETPDYNEEYASWLLRNRGLTAYKDYLRIFNPPELDTNIPKLQIFFNRETNTGCPKLIEAIKACSYDKPKDGRPAEDVAEFDGDDPYDTLRYLVDAADSYFDEAEKEFQTIQEQQRIIDRFHQNQDMTAFYRNMARVESNTGEGMIARYSHRGRR